MKIAIAASLLITLLLLPGCATDNDQQLSDVRVRLGMSRETLRHFFGEPVRIEAVSGGENWYYRFGGWKSQPSQDSGTTYDGGQRTTTAGISFSKDTEERPVHLSPDGHVIDPLPAGRIIKN